MTAGVVYVLDQEIFEAHECSSIERKLGGYHKLELPDADKHHKAIALSQVY